MKIILLPGMDGTGKLFEPFRQFLSEPTVAIPLPQSGSQSYESLAAYIEAQLPGEDFIIVAESFSGPIAALLAAKGVKNLKGIVFVATFLSCPAPSLVSLAKFFPIKFLLNVPFAKLLISKFLLGGFNCSIFTNALREVPNAILRKRLVSISNLKMKNLCIHLPVIYLRATSDFLISSDQVGLFGQSFKNLKVEHVKGTHFFLQSNPKACSEIINKFFQHV